LHFGAQGMALWYNPTKFSDGGKRDVAVVPDKSALVAVNEAGLTVTLERFLDGVAKVGHCPSGG
jgi:hypothetical protein